MLGRINTQSRRPSNTPQSPPPPSGVPSRASPHYSNNYNQSVRGASSPIVWTPPSNPIQVPSAAYPVQGGRPQQGGFPQWGSFSPRSPDNGAYSGAPLQQGNAVPSLLQNECRAWFFAIDQDEDGTLSSEELRHALLNNRGLRFSVNTVKYLMSVFDRDGNGVITYDEFEPLWIYMTEWRQMFDAFDRDRDGSIDAGELGGALAHYGLHVGPHILDILVKKYGVMSSRNRQPGFGPVLARLQMNLDQFVCASVVVRQMCELYERCSAGEQPQISRDQFLQSVICLP